MNLPNILTVLRIILTLIFVFFLRQDGLWPKVLALLAFTMASLTDFLDGFYARKYNFITKFGKIMDPIADKFLMLSAFYIFMQGRVIAPWMFIIIFVREVTVTALRLAAAQKGSALAAEGAGKVKTVLQIVAVYLIMIFIILAQFDINAPWYPRVVLSFVRGIYFFMAGVVLITLGSGLSFVWNNRKELFNVR